MGSEGGGRGKGRRQFEEIVDVMQEDNEWGSLRNNSRKKPVRIRTQETKTAAESTRERDTEAECV